MKMKIFSTLGVAALAFTFSACGGPAPSNNAAANGANKSNTAPTNTNAANTSNASNAANTSNASNTAAAKPDGDVLNIDEAGITMNVPKGFKFSKDGDDTVVKTEDEGVDVRFTVPKDGDYNKIVADAAKEIDDYLSDVKITEQPAKDNVNGMEATTLSGTAKNDGEDVLWSLTVINAPKRPVLANIYAEKSSLDKHSAAVKAFLDSVKKM